MWHQVIEDVNMKSYDNIYHIYKIADENKINEAVAIYKDTDAVMIMYPNRVALKEKLIFKSILKLYGFREDQINAVM